MAVKLVSLCLLALLGSPAWAQYSTSSQQRPQTGLFCQVAKKLKTQCGRPGISAAECQNMNCCFDGQMCYYGGNRPPPPQDSSCEVMPQYKIECGLPGISESDCHNMNCCFDGQLCYYGKKVTLQCTKDGQFIVVIARDATLPSIDLQSVHFKGPGDNCQPVATSSAFAIYQFAATDCGTLMMDSEQNIVTYENRISSSYEVAVGPYGSITRDSQFDLLVRCRYMGSSVDALVIEVLPDMDPLPVKDEGPLYVELRLGNGQCMAKGCNEEDVAYNSYYHISEYPVSKVLREPVYVEVRMLEKNDPNLVLTLGRCWATSNPNPASFPQWDLLVDGCPYRDDRYLTTLVPVHGSPDLPFPSHYRRFIFKMFTFVASGPPQQTQTNTQDMVMTPLQEMVYIHCETAVCRQMDGCEPRCYGFGRRRRDLAAPETAGPKPESTIVTSPGIIFRSPSDESQ